MEQRRGQRTVFKSRFFRWYEEGIWNVSPRGRRGGRARHFCNCGADDAAARRELRRAFSHCWGGVRRTESDRQTVEEAAVLVGDTSESASSIRIQRGRRFGGDLRVSEQALSVQQDEVQNTNIIVIVDLSSYFREFQIKNNENFLLKIEAIKN